MNYLYYKLYQATSKSSLGYLSQLIASIYTGGLLGINFLVIYIFLVKIDLLPYLFSTSKQGSWAISLFVLFTIIYFRKNRHDVILKKYKDEGEHSRIKGNILVGLYVLISFLLIFVVGLFRPGKL